MKATLDWHSLSGADYCPEPERAGYAQLQNYTPRFGVWGQGPPLVLVPGLAGGFELLGPLVRLLARDFQVISYQLRGEDDCFSLRRGFDRADLVQDLHEFLGWMGLERPGILGVSFGGILALELAIRRPHRLQALIVQGIGARFQRGLLQQVASIVLSRYPLPSDNPFVNQFFNLLFGGRQKSNALFQFVTRQCWQTDQSVMAHRFHLVEGYNAKGDLKKVQVPTLVLAGNRDVLVSQESLDDLMAELPRGRLVSLKGCGHLAFVTQAERVAQEVKRFCTRELGERGA